MRRLKHIVVACLCLTWSTGLVTPRPAKAQWLVYDAVNWIENATQVIQQVYEIYQQYEQLINDYQRYATMVKNLERFDELSFRSLVGLAVAVNDIIQYGESLGHTLDDIDAQFAETFPGYEPILEEGLAGDLRASQPPHARHAALLAQRASPDLLGVGSVAAHPRTARRRRRGRGR
jgi:P-type conjugative transfer protein TrbJ